MEELTSSITSRVLASDRQVTYLIYKSNIFSVEIIERKSLSNNMGSYDLVTSKIEIRSDVLINPVLYAYIYMFMFDPANKYIPRKYAEWSLNTH